MLRRFESVRGCGIFDNFCWNNSVPDFERINLIHGTNGAGKTSLARMLDNLGAESGGFANVSITVSKPDRTNPRTSSQQHVDEFDRVYVFSDGYVERSHNFSGDPEVEVVLTLAERNVEDEKRIAELNQLIEATNTDLDAATKKARTAVSAVDGEYETIAKGIVTALSRAGGVYRSNGSYNKGVAKRHFECSQTEWALLAEDQKDAELSTVNSDNREKVAARPYSLAVRAGFRDEAEALFDESPISEMLDTLKDHQDAASWVESGRRLHEGADTCIFCGGQLTDVRKERIEAHFSKEVERVQASLDDLIGEVCEVQTALANLLGDGTVAGILFDDLRTNFNAAHKEAEAQVTRLADWLKALRELLEKKRSNVVAKVSHDLMDAPSVDGAKIESALNEHNKRVDNHAALVQQAARRIELHLLKEAEAKITGLVDAADKAAKERAEAETTLGNYREEVAALQNVDGDPLPSAEVMARELTRILGRNELSFELLQDGKHYRVTRHGSPARNLSSGERTAITLIQFLEHVKKIDTKGGKPIVVIDDPVSSLDSGAAMGISTYLWSEAVSKEHIEQIFLLTHNFELFRQWDIQIHGLPGKRGADNSKGYTSNCYELIAPHQNVGGVSKRVPAFIDWPPNEEHRLKVRSAYHHTFITAVRARAALLDDGSIEKRLDALLLYPNVLRRMLETFLAFKNPESVGNFTAAMRDAGVKLTEIGYEGDADALRLHLTRFTHASSHAESPETDSVINPDEIENVISSVFTFMSVLDREHFEGLCTVFGIEPSDLLLEPPSVVDRTGEQFVGSEASGGAG